jgi:hypothetical protein
MYSTGAYSDSEIADWMNSQQLVTKRNRGFSKDTIREMMQNVFYTGNVLYKGSREKFIGTSYRNEEGVLSKGLHQPAIDDELFRKCQLIRKGKNNSNKSKQNTKKVYLLQGIIKCDCCERLLRAQSALNGSRYYREVSKIRGFEDCKVNNEIKKSINAKMVEDQIEKIIELLTLPESWKSEIQKLIDGEYQNFEDIELKKVRIEKKINRTMENYEMGYYENKINSYKQKIGLLREQLLELQRPTDSDIQQAAEIVLSIKGVWAIASDCEKIKMVKMMFKEVGVSIREGTIVWIKPQFGFEKLFSVIPGFILNENGRYLIG